jgi:hypothetical protein
LYASFLRVADLKKEVKDEDLAELANQYQPQVQVA